MVLLWLEGSLFHNEPERSSTEFINYEQLHLISLLCARRIEDSLYRFVVYYR